MSFNQKTIKKNIYLEGIGLHSGSLVKLKILPQDTNSGIFFIRSDLKSKRPIYANWNNIVPANLCTKIANQNGDTVSTIEHLMFALYSLGITNLKIEIDGPEVPIMDGSSKIFIEEFLKNELLEQNEEVKKIKIEKNFEIKKNNKFIRYERTNNDYLDIEYTLNYNDEFIKNQKLTLKNAQQNYSQVYNCRTFCHQNDLEKIFAMGLAKGGSLDNAIVISGNKVLNQDGLRYKDEFVRHKILDCLGDLYLSGFFFCGKIICNQGGHELTASLLKKIFTNKNNFQLLNVKKLQGHGILKKTHDRKKIVAVV